MHEPDDDPGRRVPAALECSFDVMLMATRKLFQLCGHMDGIVGIQGMLFFFLPLCLLLLLLLPPMRG